MFEEFLGPLSVLTGLAIIIFLFRVIMAYGHKLLGGYTEEGIMQKGEFKAAFFANTERRQLTGSRFVIKCTKGRWSVDGRNEEEVIREAVAAFLPYFQKGEYEEPPKDVGGHEESMKED